MSIILASQSPRRRQLLGQIGLDHFIVRPARGEEIMDPALSPAQLVEEPVDTTAAGDLWAAGFLYGVLRERPLMEAAWYGSLISSEVVKVVGSELPEPAWNEIKGKIAK